MYKSREVVMKMCTNDVVKIMEVMKEVKTHSWALL